MISLGPVTSFFQRRRTERRLRSSGALNSQIAFYASGWMDEVWIRSTALDCHQRGVRVCLVCDGPEDVIPAQDLGRYQALGIPVLTGAEAALFDGCGLVVTASTGPSVGRFRGARRVHMPHSLVSLHMIYGPDSFDAFTDLLAAGPHQRLEFSALSAWRSLPDRQSFAVGYGKLDLLSDPAVAVGRGDGSVLIAPSWGPNNLFAALSLDWIDGLLESGIPVLIRPHPMFGSAHPDLAAAVEQRFGARQGCLLEDPAIPGRAIMTASVLVTDYSGTALEFAALRLCPTVFVDVPPKVFNPDYPSLGLVPVELSLRSKIGLLAPATVSDVGAAVREALRQDACWEQRVAAHLPEFIYHPGRCAPVAADILQSMLEGRV